MPKISIVMPAYNEGRSIASLVQKIKDILTHEKMNDHEIIVVDDGSIDNTAEESQKKGAIAIKHPYNIGNGAAVKTGMRAAKGDIILLLDADGQHDPIYIPELINSLKRFDMAVGARVEWADTLFHRRIANKFYNLFASYLVNRKIQDLTSGYRAMKSSIAKKFIYLLPNTFSYPSTLTMSFSRTGHSIAYIPIKLKTRMSKSKINLIADGTRFILIMMKIATFFSPLRIFIPLSMFSLAIGLGHAGYKILIQHGRYTGFSILFITTGTMIFLLGLIAEQITQLRFERSEE